VFLKEGAMPLDAKRKDVRQEKKRGEAEQPIFGSVEGPSGEMAGRARTIAIWLGLFTCAILVSQFGRPSRAREAQFLRTAAKVESLGKGPAGAPVASKIAKERIADAKEVTTATYVSHKYGVAWQYPRTYVLRKGANANLNLSGHSAAASAFARSGGFALATVNIPARLYPGTNFNGASLTARVNPRISETECGKFRFSVADGGDDAEFPATPASVGAIDFAETDVEVDEEESAPGRATQEKFYHVYENAACYEFAMSVTTATTTGGAKQGETAVDADGMFERLDEILTSVTIVPVRIAATPAESNLHRGNSGLGD
jgi:hypothetical protein